MNETITRAQLIAQVKAAKPKTKEQRNAITCALIGRSKIVDGCMGEVYCGRCGDKIADQWTGSFQSAPESVRIGHNCRTCRANYKKLDWRHKLYVPDPFKKAKAV